MKKEEIEKLKLFRESIKNALDYYLIVNPNGGNEFYSHIFISELLLTFDNFLKVELNERK